MITINQVRSHAYVIGLWQSESVPDLASQIAESPFDLVIFGHVFNKLVPTIVDKVRLPALNEKIVLGYINAAESGSITTRSYLGVQSVSELPAWFGKPNPGWLEADPVNHLYTVQFWEPAWLEAIKRQIDDQVAQGFDGVFLDVLTGDDQWKDGNYYDNAPRTDAASLLAKLVLDIKAYVSSLHLGKPFYLIGNNPITLAKDHPEAVAVLDAVYSEGATWRHDPFDGTQSQRSQDPISALSYLDALYGGSKVLAVDYPPLTDTAELFTFFRAYVEAGWFPSVTTPLQTSAQLTRGVFMGVANPASPHLVGLTTGTNYLGSVGGGAKLVGGSGSDYFVGSVGATRMEGGAGNDMFYAHSATAYSAGKLTLEVSGNTVKGVPPKINVLVNGLLVAVGIEVTAAKETGQRQELSVMLPSGEITSIEIQHTNDVFITSIEDRNVYLHSVNLNSRVLTMNDGTYVRDYGLPPIPGQTDIVWGGRMFWNGVPVQEAMISVDAGGARIFGDAGIDTVVYETSMNEVRITQSASAVTVSFSTGLAPDEMSGIERLHFSDTKVALDINGNGGMAYRLYQAAFNRSPDEGGLGYQMNALDNGLNIAQVAANFIASPEFNATYGNLNDTQFVAQLYQNVLHRGPDAGGLAFHTGNLANGANTRANVLVGFSESPENQAALIGTIQNGMVYTL